MQKICPFCKKKNLLFLFCTPIFTKLPHQFLYYTHLFNKIFIFSHYHLSHKPNTTHSHHHPTTQPPPSSDTITQPPSHSTKLPSMKFTYPFNRATINQPPKTQIQRSIINLPNHHHQATQQKFKDPITIINLPKSKDPKTHLSKSQNPLEIKKNHRW